MSTRKRFRRSRLASSDQYFQSKDLHREYIKECHERNKEIVESLSIDITVSRPSAQRRTFTNKKPFIKVFGTLVAITIEEVNIVDTSMTIVWI